MSDILSASNPNEPSPWDDMATDAAYETVYDDTDDKVPSEGIHPAEVLDTVLVDNPFEDAKPGEKVLQVTFCLESTYKDDDGNEQHHIVRSKKMKFAYGKKANLALLTQALTNHAPVTQKRQFIKDDQKKVALSFYHPMLRGMKCSVIIKHALGEDRTYANIESYKATPEQQKENRLIAEKALKTYAASSTTNDQA